MLEKVEARDHLVSRQRRDRWAIVLVFPVGSCLFIASGIDGLTIDRAEAELRVAGMSMFLIGSLIRLHLLRLRQRSSPGPSRTDRTSTSVLLAGSICFQAGITAFLFDLSDNAVAAAWLLNILGGAGFTCSAWLDKADDTPLTRASTTLTLLGASGFLAASVLGLVSLSEPEGVALATTSVFFAGSTCYLAGSVTYWFVLMAEGPEPAVTATEWPHLPGG